MKTQLSKYVFTLVSLFFYTFTTAQTDYSNKQINGSNYFAIVDNTIAKTVNLIDETNILKQLVSSSQGIEFRLVNSYTDDLKLVHKKFNLFYNGIEVKGMDFVVHEKNGIVQYLNGTFEKIENVTIVPTLSEQSSFDKATQFFITSTVSKLSNNINPVNKGLCLVKKPSNSAYELAYKILIDNRSANSKYIYVNANDGSIVNYENLVCNTNVAGTAQTRYSGTQNFTTDQQGSQYRLREVRNGVNIKTLNANNESSLEVIVNSATDFWDTNDNIWTVAEHGVNQVATDAHWGMEKVYDYWLTKHNRNSINNAGMNITSYVHVANNLDNAFWDRDKNAMFYGDGGSIFRPLISLDVCAHELGHGICQYTANLSYAANTESQALNEGFSDIWGASVEAYAAPNKQRWLIGEEITQVAPFYLRSMSNPPSGFGAPSSDTYGDVNWNNQPDGHYRSGVLNKWYYLLSDGGNGTNGIGNSYSVTGISISKAEKIAYRTEQLLNSSADYAMARTMSIQAARELYGTGSCEEIAVTSSWYAVGVGANYQLLSVINGSDNICSSHQATYSITPINTNTVWSVSGISGANATPAIGTTTTVTIPASVTVGTITLNAVVTGGCGTLSKQIQIIQGNIPSSNSFSAYITQGGATTNMNSYCNKLTAGCGTNFSNPTSKGSNSEQNIVSRNSWCASGYITDPTVNSISWSVLQTSTGTFHGSYYFSGNQFNVSINANYPSEWIVLRCTRTNSCGSSNDDYKFYATGYCIGSPTYCQLHPNDPSCPMSIAAPVTETVVTKIDISPNPSTGQFNVTLNSVDKMASIKEIIVKDKMGTPIYHKIFNSNQKQQQINLSTKSTDIYMVEIFDGKTWATQKLSLQR